MKIIVLFAFFANREKMDRNLNISVEEKNWGEGKGEKWGGG